MGGFRAEHVSFSDMISVYSPPILSNALLICALVSGGPITLLRDRELVSSYKWFGWLSCLLLWIEDDGYLSDLSLESGGRSLLV